MVCLKMIYNCEGFTWEIKAWERSDCLPGALETQALNSHPCSPKCDCCILEAVHKHLDCVYL